MQVYLVVVKGATEHTSAFDRLVESVVFLLAAGAELGPAALVVTSDGPWPIKAAISTLCVVALVFAGAVIFGLAEALLPDEPGGERDHHHG